MENFSQTSHSGFLVFSIDTNHNFLFAMVKRLPVEVFENVSKFPGKKSKIKNFLIFKKAK